ncbi:ATP-dependent RNA helicase DBP8 [Magnaporthiopsis poae ATCC 64411]|uniref:ATP-dependent RNA helicase DBP8 n=1 Tax=Magnaporthiopsis poae (strain ATCC 64411 / 73-15) TaxID=644358 RepID=A0A0C4DKR8_MAGP6|nr:ATP-dependent RNA helicase DBP8 [Magnaporthiopsis poae ATCC 64411]
MPSSNVPGRARKAAQPKSAARPKPDCPGSSNPSSDVESASQGGGGSDSDDESGPGSGSESGESDQLDSPGSRKRRKVLLDVDHGDEDDEDKDEDEDEDDADMLPAKKASSFNVPSRIKRQLPRAEQAVSASAVAEAARSIADLVAPKRILAPTDASTSFESLGVRPWLVQSLSNMAIKRPTGIQKGCIPEILKGRDCIGGSRTGSGKTVAFAVPILQKWAQDPSAIFAVVLTPTRELALQMYEQFKAISSPHVLKAVLITGGSDMRPQAIALAQRPHIVIATPGRLADHIRTSGEDTICGLRRVRFVVLDEADRLLAGGGTGSMLPDVEECLGALPPPTERQTLLFTATVTPEVRALKDMPPKPGKEPVFVCEVDTQTLAIPATLSQTHLQVPVTHREHYLHELLLTEANAERSVIIFCNRTATAQFLHHMLRLLEHRPRPTSQPGSLWAASVCLGSPAASSRDAEKLWAPAVPQIKRLSRVREAEGSLAPPGPAYLLSGGGGLFPVWEGFQNRSLSSWGLSDLA